MKLIKNDILEKIELKINKNKNITPDDKIIFVLFCESINFIIKRNIEKNNKEKIIKYSKLIDEINMKLDETPEEIYKLIKEKI